jgi:proteasome lid subunit RPN8/RPN11
LHRAAHDAIVAHALAERPRECCGVLLGAGEEIVEAVATMNLATSGGRYFIDPKGHVAARRDARLRGLDVVGFYHSHPHAPALPSARDLAEATYPESLYLIVSLSTAQPGVSAYRFTEGNFLEVPLVTVP